MKKYNSLVKTINAYEYRNLQALAMMPNEGQVRDKMQAYSKEKTGKSLEQLSYEELNEALKNVDPMVDQQLSGFEKTMLGADGIAEGKRLAKKILQEELLKKQPKEQPKEPAKPQTSKPAIAKPSIPRSTEKPEVTPQSKAPGKSKKIDVTSLAINSLNQIGINLDQPIILDRNINNLLGGMLTKQDLINIVLEKSLRQIERKDPNSFKIKIIENNMPQSANKDNIFNLSDEILSKILLDYKKIQSG
jgi:hypothetical protein